MPSSGLSIGTAAISGGTTTAILYDNAGVLGEYTVTGTGNSVMSASPTFTGTITGAAANFSGNVGIGTTSPTAALHVIGANYLSAVVGAALYPELHFYSNGATFGNIGSGNVTGAAATDLGIQTPSGKKIFLAAGGTAAALTVSGANVGIGTASPNTSLHVYASGVGGAKFDAGTAPLNIFTINNSQFATFGSAGGALTGGTATDLAFQTSSGGNIQFATNGTALANIRMTIASGGNVGIGTTAPTQKLQVNGTISSTSGGVQFPDGTTQTTAATGGGSYVRSITYQSFTSSGTYTPNANLIFAVFQMGAAGGNNGSSVSGGSGNTGYWSCSGGTGGTGGAVEAVYSAATIGASKAITIGATGSSTSLGSLITCTSGTNGTNASGACTDGTKGSNGSCTVTSSVSSRTTFPYSATFVKTGGNTPGVVYVTEYNSQ